MGFISKKCEILPKMFGLTFYTEVRSHILREVNRKRCSSNSHYAQDDECRACRKEAFEVVVHEWVYTALNEK